MAQQPNVHLFNRKLICTMTGAPVEECEFTHVCPTRPADRWSMTLKQETVPMLDPSKDNHIMLNMMPGPTIFTLRIFFYGHVVFNADLNRATFTDVLGNEAAGLLTSFLNDANRQEDTKEKPFRETWHVVCSHCGTDPAAVGIQRATAADAVDLAEQKNASNEGRQECKPWRAVVRTTTEKNL